MNVNAASPESVISALTNESTVKQRTVKSDLLPGTESSPSFKVTLSSLSKSANSAADNLGTSSKVSAPASGQEGADAQSASVKDAQLQQKLSEEKNASTSNTRNYADKSAVLSYLNVSNF